MTVRSKFRAATSLLSLAVWGASLEAFAAPPEELPVRAQEPSDNPLDAFLEEAKELDRLKQELRYGDFYWGMRDAIARLVAQYPSNHPVRGQIVEAQKSLERGRASVCTDETKAILRKGYHATVRDGLLDDEGRPLAEADIELAHMVWNYCFDQYSPEYGVVLIRVAEVRLGVLDYRGAEVALRRARENFEHLAASDRTPERMLAIRWGSVLALQGTGRLNEAHDELVDLAQSGSLEALIGREELLTMLARASLVAGEAEAARQSSLELYALQGERGRPSWHRLTTVALLARSEDAAGNAADARRWLAVAHELLAAAASESAPRIDTASRVATLLTRKQGALPSREGRDRATRLATATLMDSDMGLSSSAGVGGQGHAASPLQDGEKPRPVDPVAAARATALIDMARLSGRHGERDKAIRLARKALELDLDNYRSRHSALVRDHLELSDLHLLHGEPALAMKELEAAALALPPRSTPLVKLTIESNRAVAHEQLGNWADAIEGHRKVLDALVGLLGEAHPKVAIAHHNLASALRSSGDYDQSAAEYLAAQAVVDAVQGRDSPEAANVRRHRAVVALAADDLEEAAELIIEATRNRGRTLLELMELGTESERMALVASIMRSTDTLLTISVHPEGGTSSVREQALEAVLRRKGLALEMTARERALATDTEAQSSLAELRELRRQRARLWFHTDPEVRDAGLHEVDAQIERHERVISRRVSIAESRAASPTATVTELATALTTDQVLIEYVRYQHVSPRAPSERERWATAHYAAFVLTHRGEVFVADLGPAAGIDAEVTEFRHALQRPDRDPQEAAKQLYGRLLAPLQAAIGPARRWHVAPDGALSLVPFEALVDVEGRYVLETASLTYLTSGRDLIAPVKSASDATPLVIAAPDYDAGTGGGSALGHDFVPLPGARREADRIKLHFPAARVVTGAAASKAAVLEARAPKILHIATHGFFLGDVEPDPTEGSRGLTLSPGSRPIEELLRGDPMLRSGLALAGANRDPDGILTAAEATSLDLGGTALVVLSACETGVGETSSSQGTFGIQRSVLLAGAETLVMSLWAVSDDATQATMDGYYRRLAEGGGRSEALRQAKLELLSDPTTAHPFYWAPFIALGHDENLDGREFEVEFPNPAPPPVERGDAKGCRVTDPAGSSAVPLLVLLGASLRWRRRRRHSSTRNG